MSRATSTARRWCFDDTRRGNAVAESYNSVQEVTAVAVRAETKADDAKEQLDEQLPPIVELTPEESRAWYEQQVEKLLGITAEEFLARLSAGEYDATMDEPPWDVLYLAMLAPSAARR